MGIESLFWKIGRNKRKGILFLFSIIFSEKGKMREKNRKKSIIKNTFFKKILSYYFQKVKSLRKLSEFSKTPHFSPKLSFIIKTNPETENLFRRHINYAKFNF